MIFSHHPWCSCTLSCNSDSSAPVWKQTSCILSINVRGDIEFFLLCLGYKRRSQRNTHRRPFLLLLWEEFFFFFISKLLASKDRTSSDERRPCRAGRNLSFSLSLFCMYFEVLCRVISEGGSSSALQMNAFSILVVLIKMCVSVFWRKRLISRGLLKEGVWVNQNVITARLMRIREQEWRLKEKKGRRHMEESPVSYQWLEPLCDAPTVAAEIT